MHINLSMEHPARKGSQKNWRNFSDDPSGKDSKPEKSSKRKIKYIKLYELTQAATAPVRKAKEPPTDAKLEQSTVKTPFQKSIASDLDMRNELYNRDKREKDYRKKIFTVTSRIVDTFLKESRKGEKTAPVEKPKEQPIVVKLRKSTAKIPIQKSIASDLDMRDELDNRDKTEKYYRKKMSKICSSIIDTFLKKLVKGKKTAPVGKPKGQAIHEFGKSTGKGRFQNSVASGQEFNKMSEYYGIIMLVVEKYLKEFVKGENLLM